MKARLLLTVLLVLAACGGDGAATTTEAPSDAPGNPTETALPEPPTTTAAPTTTVAETTTTVAAAGGADCLVGTWELDSAAFIAQIFAQVSETGEETGFEELGDVEVSHGGGSFLVTMAADGTYVGDRDNWQIRISSEEGAFVNTLDGEEAGTWSVAGDQLTIDSVSSTIAMSFAAEIDGVLQELPFGGTQTVASRELGGTGAFSCDDDTLEVTFEEAPSTFARR